MCKDRKRQSVAGGRPGGAGEQEDAGRPLHSGLAWGLFSGSCSGLGCRERGTEETLPGGATQVRVGTRDSSSSQHGPGLLTEKEVPAPQKPHQLSPLPPPPGTPPLLSEKSPVFFFLPGVPQRVWWGPVQNANEIRGTQVRARPQLGVN